METRHFRTFGFTLLAALALTLSLASVAGAASPAAVTGSVSNLSTTSVRLHGSGDPHSEATSWDFLLGQETSLYFEFGQTTAYGTKTATQSAGSGANPTNVRSDVSGLSVATMFHYR